MMRFSMPGGKDETERTRGTVAFEPPLDLWGIALV